MTTWWRTGDVVALAGAGLLFVGVLGWSALAEANIRSTGTQGLEMQLVGEWSGVAVGFETEVSSADWPDPAEGAATDAWVFDVFTPPVIYYDRDTGRFAVSPPELTAPVESEIMATPFGVDLVRIVREPFRLQLIGYAGTEAEPLGIFRNNVAGAGVVARMGKAFPELGLQIRNLVIRREDSIVPYSMPLREIVAVAEIWDERAQRAIELSSARPAWNTQPVAEIRLQAAGDVQTVQAGNRIETDEGVYEVSGVFSEPDSISMVKQLPNGSREIMTLTPELPAEPQFEGDSVFETP